MNHQIVYLAGPMTGIEDFNYPAFDAAEAAWKARGWLVESPTKAGRDWGYNKPYHWYVRAGIQQLLRANAIAMLPGWQKSRGAKLEYLLAQAFGFPVYDAITFEPLDEEYGFELKTIETDEGPSARLTA